MDDVLHLLRRTNGTENVRVKKEFRAAETVSPNNRGNTGNRFGYQPIAATPQRSALHDVLRKHDLAARSRSQGTPG